MEARKSEIKRSLVPPGQFLTERFPVLTYGSTPDIDLEAWRFRIFGLVEADVNLDWRTFLALPQVALTADFHCVTQWSRLDNMWEGVLFKEIMNLATPTPDARYVTVHCYGGYTTSLPLEVLMGNDVLLAHRQEGQPLAREHGGPLRLVVPVKYAWKSAKWVSGLELMAQDRLGFWEQRGYNNSADPWQEERFS